MNLKRSYVRLTENQKNALRNLVFRECQTIKEASKQLQIKYASAKQVIQQRRKTWMIKNSVSDSKRCELKKIKKEGTHLSVISKIGGEEICKKDYLYSDKWEVIQLYYNDIQ